MGARQETLVIGAGELGYQVLNSLARHPRKAEAVAVLLRSSSISSTNPLKKNTRMRVCDHWESPSSPEISLNTLNQHWCQPSRDTIYDHRMYRIRIRQRRAVESHTRTDVLKAKVPYYIPWQFGVDYDLIGRGSPQGLFVEQLDVRDLIRLQNETRWTIISTGMLTIFTFKPSFGVVDLKNRIVSALGGWGNRVTVTTPADIGQFAAEIVLGED